MRYLLIIGSAPCVENDYNTICSFIDENNMDYLLVGLSSIKKWDKRVDYVATYHPKDLKDIRKKRKEINGNIDYKIICHEIDKTVNEKIDIRIPYRPPSGSSALLGVLAGITLGYEKIILCGCPLEGENSKNASYKQFQKGWVKYTDQKIFEKVKSMSGWTAEFLGSPIKKMVN